MAVKHAHDVPFTRSVQRQLRSILVEGLILVILGVLAIIVTPNAAWVVNIVLGWLFLVSGMVGLITTLVGRHAPGFWWSLLSAFLGVGVGLILIALPSSVTMDLTYVLIGFFFIEGLATIMFAIEHKRHLSGRWEWMTASGVVDLALAVL